MVNQRRYSVPYRRPGCKAHDDRCVRCLTQWLPTAPKENFRWILFIGDSPLTIHYISNITMPTIELTGHPHRHCHCFLSIWVRFSSVMHSQTKKFQSDSTVRTALGCRYSVVGTWQKAFDCKHSVGEILGYRYSATEHYRHSADTRSCLNSPVPRLLPELSDCPTAFRVQANALSSRFGFR